MKFCKDCAFYEYKDDDHMCTRHSRYNLVTGERIKVEHTPCLTQRGPHAPCGTHGKLFEPRVSNVTPIKSTAKNKTTKKTKSRV